VEKCGNVEVWKVLHTTKSVGATPPELHTNIHPPRKYKPAKEDTGQRMHQDVGDVEKEGVHILSTPSATGTLLRALWIHGSLPPAWKGIRKEEGTIRQSPCSWAGASLLQTVLYYLKIFEFFENIWKQYDFSLCLAPPTWSSVDISFAHASLVMGFVQAEGRACQIFRVILKDMTVKGR
jgi:hypothetical protein